MIYDMDLMDEDTMRKKQYTVQLEGWLDDAGRIERYKDLCFLEQRGTADHPCIDRLSMK